MEFKFGSVIFLLSCSLHPSLWGILASVPQTQAKKCKPKISSEGEPVKRVQMIRRIPASCSSWDNSWSWITQKDCGTKYKLDYVQLPSVVQKVDNEDCEEEVSAPTTSGHFSMSDEKFMAIVFGLASLALLVAVAIIIISVFCRGQHRCCLCGGGGAYSYTSANAHDGEQRSDVRAPANQYSGDCLKDKSDPVYEEIFDKSMKHKLEHSGDHSNHGSHGNLEKYENLADDVSDEKGKLMNGVRDRRPVTPSAPYEEEELAHVTARQGGVSHRLPAAVPNQYGVLRDIPVRAGIAASTTTGEADNTTKSETISAEADATTKLDQDQADDFVSETGSSERFIEQVKGESEFQRPDVIDNAYSEFDELIPFKRVGESSESNLNDNGEIEEENHIGKGVEVSEMPLYKPVISRSNTDGNSGDSNRGSNRENAKKERCRKSNSASGNGLPHSSLHDDNNINTSTKVFTCVDSAPIESISVKSIPELVPLMSETDETTNSIDNGMTVADLCENTNIVVDSSSGTIHNQLEEELTSDHANHSNPSSHIDINFELNADTTAEPSCYVNTMPNASDNNKCTTPTTKENGVCSSVVDMNGKGWGDSEVVQVEALSGNGHVAADASNGSNYETANDTEFCKIAANDTEFCTIPANDTEFCTIPMCKLTTTTGGVGIADSDGLSEAKIVGTEGTETLYNGADT